MAKYPANPSASLSGGNRDTPTTGYLNGEWVVPESMCLSVDDHGFRSAATAVERLRTYHGKLFEWPAHLSRWNHTLGAIGITNTLPDATIKSLALELLDRNEAWVRGQHDVGVTIFATPGERGKETPTFAMHLDAIDLSAIQRRQSQGQPLVVTDIRQPSAGSWPRSIKVRCRLHYYLADQAARKFDADAVGVLMDDASEDGGKSITETSIANIAIVKKASIISPPSHRILDGITQQVLQQIATRQSVNWTHRPVTPNELRDADEVLLMGTDTGIWFANRVDQTVMSPGPIYSRLLAAFDEYTLSATGAS